MDINAAKQSLGTRHFTCVASLDAAIAPFELSISDRLLLKNQLVESGQLSIRAQAVPAAPQGIDLRTAQLLRRAGLHEGGRYTVAQVDEALGKAPGMTAEQRIAVKSWLDSRGQLVDGASATRQAADDRRGDAHVLREMVEKLETPEDETMAKLKRLGSSIDALVAARQPVQANSQQPRHTSCQSVVVCK